VTPDALAVLLLAAGAALLFATEALRADVVALLLLVALALSGLVSLPEALSGFSNPATATVATMFILSAGLRESGLVAGAASSLGRALGGRPRLLYAALLVFAMVVSAFVNNTAAVAVLIPLVVGICSARGLHPGRYLMSLSFASQMGGVCTLIGTSTNILVSDLAVSAGQRPFGMFEFTALGACFAGLGLAYLLVVPPLLLRPSVEPGAGILGARTAGEFVAEFETEADGVLGELFPEPKGGDDGDRPEALSLSRAREPLGRPGPETALRAGDRIMVRGRRDALLRLDRKAGLRLARDIEDAAAPPAARGDAEGDRIVVVEAFVPTNSVLAGRTLRDVAFRQRHHCVVLALRHRTALLHEGLGGVPLSVGDVLVVQGRARDVEALRAGDEVIPIQEVAVPRVHWRKAAIAVGVLACVVAVAALDLAPVLLAALGGCLALALTGVLPMDRAYAAVDGKTILLLAGVIPLGIAMQNSGAADLAGSAIEDLFGPWGPHALVAGTFLLTGLLTELMSNAATAVLLVPAALAAAISLGVDPRPLLVAIAFGASTSFMTPVGYQTNAMVLGPGGYRFRDYFRIGAPLNLAFCILAAWAIPAFVPLR